jgi:hypothetical protein
MSGDTREAERLMDECAGAVDDQINDYSRRGGDVLAACGVVVEDGQGLHHVVVGARASVLEQFRKGPLHALGAEGERIARTLADAIQRAEPGVVPVILCTLSGNFTLARCQVLATSQGGVA